jgi:hypothetical protein
MWKIYLHICLYTWNMYPSSVFFLTNAYIILSNQFYIKVLQRRLNYNLVFWPDKNSYCYSDRRTTTNSPAKSSRSYCRLEGVVVGSTQPVTRCTPRDRRITVAGGWRRNSKSRSRGKTRLSRRHRLQSCLVLSLVNRILGCKGEVDAVDTSRRRRRWEPAPGSKTTQEGRSKGAAPKSTSEPGGSRAAARNLKHQ